jgi:hypothetical protein
LIVSNGSFLSRLGNSFWLRFLKMAGKWGIWKAQLCKRARQSSLSEAERQCRNDSLGWGKRVSAGPNCNIPLAQNQSGYELRQGAGLDTKCIIEVAKLSFWTCTMRKKIVLFRIIRSSKGNFAWFHFGMEWLKP